MIELIDGMFWVGSGLIVLTIIYGRTVLAPSVYKSSKAKLCILMYLAAFFLIGFGWIGISNRLGISNSWIYTAGNVVLGMLAFGSFLELRRDLPLLPRNMQKMVEKLKKENFEVYVDFLSDVEISGLLYSAKKHWGE